ncbi:MAG: putative Shikimate kinase [Devosia sp.]|uniref:shikimate kinase n=1 Tax=Devosia sp. TaxID=1871048 RepID=UPI002604B081|nr:shikimate kinase [Devosia sp.]MDB5527931.1 putative Shikimate kinase [Devosia sp.]
MQVYRRREWSDAAVLFLLGPGGAGKSTLGKALSAHLGWPLIDLDLAFCEQIDIIGPFIARHGYERYRAQNLQLAERLVASAPRPAVFVTSSGFLAADQQSNDYRNAKALIATGYTVTVLPSLDVEQATQIVVARLLVRGFGFTHATEEPKFRTRFAIYKDEGDAQLIGVAPAPEMAAMLARELNIQTP